VVFCGYVCIGQSIPKAGANGAIIVMPGDSVAVVASKFVSYNQTDASYYQLAYPEADDFYKNSPDLMKKYGVAILKRYQMVQFQQEQLACYLYLLGEKEPLIALNKNKMTQNDREVLDVMLKHFHINRINKKPNFKIDLSIDN
jgi:hypothetical protein